MELLFVLPFVVAVAAIAVLVVAYLRDGDDPSPFDDLRATTVLVQTTSGRSIRGIATAVGSDAIVLAGAVELTESADLDLGDTSVVIPRDAIVYVQTGPDVVRDAAKRGL